MKKLREHDLKKVLKEKPQGAMDESFWYKSDHRDGVDMVTSGECLCFTT